MQWDVSDGVVCDVVVDAGYSRGEVERHLGALDGSAGGMANQEDKATRSHWIMAVLLTMQAVRPSDPSIHTIYTHTPCLINQAFGFRGRSVGVGPSWTLEGCVPKGAVCGLGPNWMLPLYVCCQMEVVPVDATSNTGEDLALRSQVRHPMIHFLR